MPYLSEEKLPKSGGLRGAEDADELEDGAETVDISEQTGVGSPSADGANDCG
jgi:hypothetical protein